MEAETKGVRIIGISGKIEAGKDTAAGILIKNHPQYKAVASAANVKMVVSIITGTSYEEQFTREGKAKIPNGFDKTLGKYQQIIGQGLRDLIDDDVWIKAVLQKYHDEKIIITDVRYPNEVKLIEEAGGIVIRLNRKRDAGSVNKKMIDDGRDRNHSSETALDNYKFQHVIDNGGSLQDLERQLLKIVSK